MPGLLDDVFSPEVLGLLSRQQGGGMGLLTGGWSGPKPDEGFSTRLFGNPNDPNDPRGPAMMAFSLGLLRGNVADAFEGANKAFTDTEDRVARRQLANMGLLKSGVELQSLLDTTKRNRGIREDLLALERGQQPGAMPSAASSPGFGAGGGYGTPGLPSSADAGQFPSPATPLSRVGQSGDGVDVNQPGQPAPSMQLPPLAGVGPSRRASLADNLTGQLIQQARVYARWGDFDSANKLYESAAKFQPEVKEIGTAVFGDKPVQVITYKDGRQQVSDYGPTPKVHWLDSGGSITPIDENSMSALAGPVQKTLTPADRIAAGNLRVAQERLALDANSPQYVQSGEGWIALPKRPAPGAPIQGMTVAGPDGQPLAPPLKPIPPQVNQAIISNYQNLQKAQNALALLEGRNVGNATGDQAATGWKGYVPGPLLDRMDPGGIDTRAAISDLGSMVLHDRSGAAVTAAEWPRLKPFIPTATDSAESAAKKLRRFVDVYGQEAEALNQTYSKDQGYRPSPILEKSTASASQSQPAQAMRLPPNPKASDLRVGQSYQLPNGAVGTWDGFRFRVGGN